MGTGLGMGVAGIVEVEAAVTADGDIAVTMICSPFVIGMEERVELVSGSILGGYPNFTKKTMS